MLTIIQRMWLNKEQRSTWEDSINEKMNVLCSWFGFSEDVCIVVLNVPQNFNERISISMLSSLGVLKYYKVLLVLWRKSSCFDWCCLGKVTLIQTFNSLPSHKITYVIIRCGRIKTKKSIWEDCINEKINVLLPSWVAFGEGVWIVVLNVPQVRGYSILMLLSLGPS